MTTSVQGVGVEVGAGVGAGVGLVGAGVRSGVGLVGAGVGQVGVEVGAVGVKQVRSPHSSKPASQDLHLSPTVAVALHTGVYQ